jgi:hypothetical protein
MRFHLIFPVKLRSREKKRSASRLDWCWNTGTLFHSHHFAVNHGMGNPRFSQQEVKWLRLLQRRWPPFSANRRTCFCGTSWKMESDLMPTSISLRQNSCERPSGENASVFLTMPWFFSIKIAGCTRHSSLGTGWEFRYRQVGPSPIQPGIVTRDFHLFVILKEHLAGYHFTCDEDSKCSTVLWVTQTVYPSYDPRMTNLSQRLQTSSGLR